MTIRSTIAALRAGLVDGATNLARLLDARRERDGLREQVEFVCDERDEAMRERDEYARLVATREVEIDELLRLRREVERLTAERDAASLERDAHRDDISDLATRLNAACIELDARIPTDIDGAQAWCEARGVRVERGDGDYEERWQVVIDGAVVHLASEPDDAISEAVMWALFGMWRDDA